MKPIIRSLLDVDFYKFTMGQFVWKYYPDVHVKYAFMNRTKKVKIAKAIDMYRLREELEHARTLKLSNTDLHYLRGTNEYGSPMFEEGYLQFLKNLMLPPFTLDTENGEIRLEFEGKWSEAIYWETIALSIVTELYFEARIAKLSRLERDRVFADGTLRLAEKAWRLKQIPGITVADFGTRRRASYDWQRYAVEVMADELPKHFVGTSNVRMAADLGLMPIGTNAHELAMVLAGIACDSDEAVRSSQTHLLDLWWKVYGWGLSVALPDTFGSDFFFSIMGQKRAEAWKGMRQDSGNPIEFGEKLITFYKKLGIDPKEKLIIFSDGLTVDSIIKCYERFKGRIKMSFGWGTNLTNDLGFEPVSIVVKPVEANGRGLVKLSDNLAKAIGRPEDVERYMRAFGYENTLYQECIY
ncbi:MAG: nicotinate phosphoribosyltransferase [Candidatus Sungbacteria bacterium]|nr:nicotinate phosphoribosyltransferase [Candidatus Sungbacteria bacterium]